MRSIFIIMNLKRANIFPIILLLALILVSSFPISSMSATIGKEAEPFTLKDLSGNDISLESFKGKVVFLDFWATWCSPCKEELPELEHIYKKFKGEGLEVIGISTDKSASNVVRFLEKKPVSFTILTDTEGDVASRYKLPGMPTAFIIDKEGIVRHIHFGFSKALITSYEENISELLK